MRITATFSRSHSLENHFEKHQNSIGIDEDASTRPTSKRTVNEESRVSPLSFTVPPTLNHPNPPPIDAALPASVRGLDLFHEGLHHTVHRNR